MQTYIDWFNLKSYDLYGVWDEEVTCEQAVVAPHTSLRKIDKALKLLWRSQIDPLKVNLGLGYYGLSFTLKDPACTRPGCPFSGGGNPGACTGRAGFLSNAEIRELMSSNPDIVPVFDDVALINYIAWENQWVSYDNASTYALKKKFADLRCLGGTTVWAIDLDNVTTKASRQDTILDAMRRVYGD